MSRINRTIDSNTVPFHFKLPASPSSFLNDHLIISLMATSKIKTNETALSLLIHPFLSVMSSWITSRSSFTTERYLLCCSRDSVNTEQQEILQQLFVRLLLSQPLSSMIPLFPGNYILQAYWLKWALTV